MKNWQTGNLVLLPTQEEASPEDLPVQLYGLGHEVVRSRDYRFDTESLSRWHRGEVFQLTLKGRGLFREEGPLRPVPEGKAFLASAGRPFRYEYGGGGPWEFLYLTFLGPAAVSLFSRWRRAEGALLTIRRPEALIRRVRELYERREGIGRHANSRRAYELLMLIDAAVGGDAPAVTTRQTAEGLIRRDLKGISVGALARHWGYEPHYFITWLRNGIGITPGRLIREIRMETAADHLIHSSQGVAGIADECGFEDPGLFSRRFKAYHGCSPREFRQRRRASEGNPPGGGAPGGAG